VRAFAVGYDREEHDREAKQKEEEQQAEATSKPGCRLLAVAIAIPWLVSMMTILGALVVAGQPSSWAPGALIPR